MSIPRLAALEKNFDAIMQKVHALRIESRDKPAPGARMDTGQKLNARDLLATLSRKRISIKEIHFIEQDSARGGTYGDVVVATFIRSGGGEGERKVAVKKVRFIINGDMTEEKFLRVFVNELHVLDKLSHPNIVEIIGFVEDMENRITWLVFPWEANGNLREFLLSGKWEIPERVSLILDVASGLEYLHTQQPPICHGDLKSLNVLVNSSHRAILTDFGSARIIRQVQAVNADQAIHPAASASHKPVKNNEFPQLNITLSDTALTLTGPACSLRWSPPEVLSGESLNLATDIWALGWIAWEAITDCYPFEELKGEWDITMKIIEGRLPPIHDHTQLAQIYPLCSLMQKCWRPEPKERPSATECLKTLVWMPHAIPVVKSGEQFGIRSAALLQEIGEMHYSQVRYEDASKSYEQGLAIARSTGDQSAVAAMLIRLACTNQAREKYAEAEASFREALAIYERVGSDQGRANALLGLGGALSEQSLYVEAEASYTQALDIYHSIENILGQANAYARLGSLQRLRCKYGEAEVGYTLALAFFEGMGHDRGQAEALVGLGGIQQAQSMYVEAEASYTKALGIFESHGIDTNRGSVLFWLGEIQEALFKDVEAEALYAQALAVFEGIGSGSGRAKTSLRILSIRVRQSRFTEAKALIEDLLLISEQTELGLSKEFLNQILENVLKAERLTKLWSPYLALLK